MPHTHYATTAVLDAAGAGAYLAICKDQVYRLARRGELPHARVGRSIRFRREDLDAYLHQQAMQAARARRAFEELSAKAFLAGPQPASISTLAEGRFINVNDSFLDLIGYRREDLIGRSAIALNIFADPADFTRVKALLGGRGAIRHLEVSVRAKGGAVRAVELSAKAVDFDDEKYVIATLDDITERKRREDALRLRAEELAKTNRAKDEFLAVLSRELRTPMTLILGWAGLLRSGRLGEATSSRGLEMIQRNAKMQAQLIDDLLDMSRIVAGKLRLNVRPFALAPTMESVIEVVRPTAEAKAIRINSALDPEVGPVSGDPVRLRQAFRNIIANAIKFVPDGGCIDIRLERADSHARIIVSGIDAGISPELIHHTPDRFCQADNIIAESQDGLCLELAIACHLIKLHGGTAVIESHGEGCEATFIASLPLAVTPSAEASAGVMPPKIRDGMSPDCPRNLGGLRAARC